MRKSWEPRDRLVHHEDARHLHKCGPASYTKRTFETEERAAVGPAGLYEAHCRASSHMRTPRRSTGGEGRCLRLRFLLPLPNSARLFDGASVPRATLPSFKKSSEIQMVKGTCPTHAGSGFFGERVGVCVLISLARRLVSISFISSS